MSPQFSKKQFQKKLIHWYKAHRRSLPWREKTDPYSIWISEVMLQQTRVQQAIPYYKAFMKRYPTISSLSRAGLDDVLKVWEGLGYYKRAVHLHASAKIIAGKYRGKIPSDYQALIALPGFGEYTTGAVLSLAYDQKYPAVDGNVLRILSRIFTYRRPLNKKTTKDKLTEVAASLLPDADINSFNQGLMELGAMICRPKNPACGDCPVKNFCGAYRNLKDPSVFPVKSARKVLPVYAIAVGIIIKNKKILIARRPPGALLGGLWEFPGGKQEKGESLPETCIREAAEETGIHIRVKTKLMDMHHAYSHFKVHIHAYICSHVSGRARAKRCAQIKWIYPGELAQYAFPRANRKIIERLIRCN